MTYKDTVLADTAPLVHIENYNATDAHHDEERLARKVGFRMRALGAID